MQVIVLGDKTDHGGTVISASSTLVVGGVKAALVGDFVSCPIPGHGISSINEGAESWFSDGEALAIEGGVCGCGCKLIASRTDFIIE